MAALTYVTFCLCSAVIVLSSQNEKNDTQHELKQLKETVSDLQKHMLAQEQEQRGILSDVLSKLIVTTDQLVKLQHNYTALEKKVSFLEENYTALDAAGKRFASKEVAFEASMARSGKDNSQVIQFQANSTLLFPTVQYNEGRGWNSSNGVFTAPVNGTYMFWIDLTYMSSAAFTVSMMRNNANFGKGYGRVYGLNTIMLTHISLTPLIEGDLVQFVANKNVKYWSSFSSCGGVLLHLDIQ